MNWRDLLALDDHGRRALERQAKELIVSSDPQDRERGYKIIEDIVVATWPEFGGVSEHTRREIAAAFGRGEPLASGERVPGCSCRACVPVAMPRRTARRHGSLRPALDVDAARSVSILDVSRRLHLGEPRKAGREYIVRCPLHEDNRPSLRMNVARGVWHCDVCAEGGDGIALVMRVRRCSFPDAVRELVQRGAA